MRLRAQVVSWTAWMGPLALAAVAMVSAAHGGDGDAAARSPRVRTPSDVARDIDAALERAWKAHGLTPAAPCTDAEFLRRVHLDLVGTIPSAEQVEAFLADTAEGRRSRLVETLLASPGRARHLANLWAEVFVGSGGADDDKEFVPALFRPWLERQFAEQRPFGEIVTEMLTATGTVYTNPPVNFSGRRAHAPPDLAGTVSKALLGVQIQCAQCHDHPYEEISQEDFRGVAAFFTRVTLRPVEIPYETFGPRAMERAQQRLERQVQEIMKTGVPEEEARRQAERMRPKSVEVTDIPGGTRMPRRMPGRMKQKLGEYADAQPRFLKGATYGDRAGETRRGALAAWVVDPANPWTARALANRTWAWFLGRGFVHPVDDLGSANRPSVPEALDLLAADAAESGFDLDRLARIVMSTRAYQLSSAGGTRNPLAESCFAVGPLEPLTAQETFDSLQVAAGIVADGAALSATGGDMPSSLDMEGRGAGMMAGMTGETPDRSRQLLQAAARSFFLTFDDDEGGGSEAFEGTIPQGLMLMNSQVVNGLLASPAVSVVPKLLREHATEKARIRQLFLRTLSREPAAAEIERFTRYDREAASLPAPDGPAADGAAPRGKKGGRRGAGRGPAESPQAAAYADVLWALIASTEFGTNH